MAARPAARQRSIPCSRSGRHRISGAARRLCRTARYVVWRHPYPSPCRAMSTSPTRRPSARCGLCPRARDSEPRSPCRRLRRRGVTWPPSRIAMPTRSASSTFPRSLRMPITFDTLCTLQKALVLIVWLRLTVLLLFRVAALLGRGRVFGRQARPFGRRRTSVRVQGRQTYAAP